MSLKNIYYTLKPIIPRRFQIMLRRVVVKQKRKKSEDIWPIDERAGRKPEGWPGWPGGKKFALVITHDVDTAKGQIKCRPVIELENKMGFRSSFNFVPERYKVSPDLREELVHNGFEVGVHGLRHDGDLYKSREIFLEHAVQINRYLKEWNAVGFRSPAMHYNLEWLHDLSIAYDSSTFDTDPFEPEPEGVGTIFPFWVKGNSYQRGYVELPYTLPQDFTLFILMREKNISIWKEKLKWIAEHGGMALVNIHPDYLRFDGEMADMDTYPVRFYEELLGHLRDMYEGEYWHVLPREMADYCSDIYGNPPNDMNAAKFYIEDRHSKY